MEDQERGRGVRQWFHCWLAALGERQEPYSREKEKPSHGINLPCVLIDPISKTSYTCFSKSHAFTAHALPSRPPRRVQSLRMIRGYPMHYPLYTMKGNEIIIMPKRRAWNKPINQEKKRETNERKKKK